MAVDIQADGERPAAHHTRLRKRRRSASSPIDDSARNSKRLNSRKAPSLAAKRTSTAVEIDAQSLDNTSVLQGVRASKQDATSTLLRGDESHDEATLRRILQGQSEDASLSENEDLPPENPDMHAVMSKIIDHGETIDNQYGARRAATTGPAHHETVVPQGASLQLKIQSLPILDNLVSARLSLGDMQKANWSRPVKSWPPLPIPHIRRFS